MLAHGPEDSPSLEVFRGERIHNHRPSGFYPLKYESRIINCSVDKYPFVAFGLSGSLSMSFLVAKIVAANKMANFLSSVMTMACTWC